jgi:hypothetical protein
MNDIAVSNFRHESFALRVYTEMLRYDERA